MSASDHQIQPAIASDWISESVKDIRTTGVNPNGRPQCAIVRAQGDLRELVSSKSACGIAGRTAGHSAVHDELR
jgi:hypothetical protein